MFVKVEDKPRAVRVFVFAIFGNGYSFSTVTACCVVGLSIQFFLFKKCSRYANDLNWFGDRNFKITGSE